MKLHIPTPWLFALSLSVAACGASTGEVGGDGSGNGQGDGGAGGAGGALTEQCGSLTAILRDFRKDHPDMQRAIGDQRGLAKAMLGPDHKPVYAPDGSTAVSESAASFAQWYRDVPDINMHFESDLPIEEVAPGNFVFEDNSFFPLDGLGFPNEEINGHNFHFTTEINASFRYRGGELFSFKGDDDVFVFVNDRLALDLGGVHGVEEGTIDFDALAAELGISTGGVYRLDVFHAERHTSESNFRIETSIDCLNVID